MTMEQREASKGYFFILPWLIGFLILFLKPILQSLYYSFQGNVKFTAQGMTFEPAGWQNYVYAFVGDEKFIRNLSAAFGSLAYQLPLILAFSLFVAIVLNQKFAGRTFARVIFFLPVIIASGIVITVMQNSWMDTSMAAAAGASAGASADPSADPGGSVYVIQDGRLLMLLYQSGLSPQIVSYLVNVISQIFDIAWQSGVQILLFLAGLQSIPKSFYEASHLEGATSWEVFWKITFPLISPITLVCIVYTIIESFSSPKNPVITQIFGEFALLNVTYSATLSWIYFVIICIVLAVIVRLIGKKVVYMED